jgi:broad-specificity NMP kinase
MTDAALSIVAGAPGAGKSAALAAFLDLDPPFMAFDIDWLIESSSALAGSDIHFDEASWPAYRALWLDVLRGVVRNGHQAVLFAALAPADLPEPPPVWCGRISWLLLDCSDEIREERLRARGWGDGRVREALNDAAELRSALPTVIRTDDGRPETTADEVARWLQSKATQQRRENDGARDEGGV